MRAFLGFIVFMGTLAVIVLGGGFFFAYSQWTGSGPLQAETGIVIEKGTGVSGIAEQLMRAGIISNATVFKVAARARRSQATLKAGEYAFPPAASMRSVMDAIARGAVVDRKITIPEGRTSWQVVQIIAAAPMMTGTIATIPAEGSLLPETYHTIRDMDRQALMAQMAQDMQKTISALWPDRDPDLPFGTEAEAITLASIVEKETGVASERARIAGVFVNRLRKGMPLQTDPSVIYALTKGAVKDDGMGPLGRRLLRKDIEETESPYNTYKHAGLPPGPIANPGRAAIAAVLHPEKHDYLYFVADGSGGHIFAVTLDEHERNAAKWRQIRKEQGN